MLSKDQIQHNDLGGKEEKEMKIESGVKKHGLVYQHGETDNDTDQD